MNAYLPRVAALLASVGLLLAACGGSGAAPASSPAATASAIGSGSPQASTPSAAAAAKPESAQASAAASAAGLPKLTIPYSAISVSQAPLWVPVEAGLYKKYGLDVTTEYIATSSTLAPAMLSGQIPLAIAGEDTVINANLNGGDLVITGAGIDHFLFSIYAVKGINSMADLKGKKLGITKTAAATDFAGRLALAKNNLAPGKDVAVLQMGGQPEILAGMQAGAIDAGVLAPPTTAGAKRAGYVEIATPSSFGVTYYQSPIGGKKGWIKDHRDVTMNVMKAYAEGLSVIHRDKELAIKVIAKYTKTTDQSTLDDAYQALVGTLPKSPLPLAEAIVTGLKQAEAEYPAAKTVDPNSFIDASFAEELQKTGFIDALYK